MAPSMVLDDTETVRLNSKESRATNVSDLQRYGNPSLQVTADHRIKLEEAPIQEPGPGEVLIHVKTTGICG